MFIFCIKWDMQSNIIHFNDRLTYNYWLWPSVLLCPLLSLPPAHSALFTAHTHTHSYLIMSIFVSCFQCHDLLISICNHQLWKKDSIMLLWCEFVIVLIHLIINIMINLNISPDNAMVAGWLRARLTCDWQVLSNMNNIGVEENMA